VEKIFSDMMHGMLDSVCNKGCSLNHDNTSSKPSSKTSRKFYLVYPTTSLCRLAVAISPSSTKLAKSYETFRERNHNQFGDAIPISQVCEKKSLKILNIYIFLFLRRCGFNAMI
jgi:hypothetical protein